MKSVDEMKENAVTVERAGWILVVLAAGASGYAFAPKRAAEATRLPLQLSPEVQAYIDRKMTSATSASGPDVAAACQTRLEKMRDQLNALEGTAKLRAAAQAKCELVYNDFKNLFIEQFKIGVIMRDQEVGRLRDLTAATCAEARMPEVAPKRNAANAVPNGVAPSTTRKPPTNER